jgi:hypothetical protein
MSAKQDRQGVRTAAQLEQKWKFGETFAKVMGIAEDAQRKAEEAGNSLEGLDQETIFNILTNNGQAQGLYRDDDGNIFINASYMVLGILASLNGATKLNLNTGSLTTEDTDAGWKLDLSTGKIVMYGDGEKKILRLDNLGFGGAITFWNPETGGFNGGLQGMIDHVLLNCDAINPGKKVLFSGNVASGSTFEVPNTEHYDLFAVKLGTSTTTDNTVVMAYKVGNTIRGVGGWSGDATQNIKLMFLSATFSGNTWTLQDATSKELAGNSVGSAVNLNVKEVVGVI